MKTYRTIQCRKKQLFRTMAGVMLSLAVLQGGSGQRVFAEETEVQDVLPESGEEAVPALNSGQGQLLASNLHDNNYTWYWSSVMNSYLVPNASGGYTRVQYANGAVYVEDYNRSFGLVGSRILQAELPLFGGFYDDGSSYYLVYGQTNHEQNDGKEIMRIVRYSHQWERLGTGVITGSNTTVPFDAGNLRMTAGNGFLYIRTAHEMYRSSDGYNHQSCMTFKIRISDMAVVDSAYTVQNSSAGYVSHSFNQFIKLDSGNLVTLDHGDAHPRSAVLSRYTGDALGQWYSVSTVDTLNYAGSIGANNTNATLGGFEVSDTAYLTAGSSGPQDWIIGNGGKNIYVTATPKDNFTREATRTEQLTYHADASHACSNPYLVEISKTKYLVIWEEQDSSGACSVKYAFLNGNGVPESQLFTGNANLSDCQPIYHNDRVLWYVSDGSSVKFYSIGVPDGTLIQGALPQLIPGWPYSDVEVIPGNWKFESVNYVHNRYWMGTVGASSEFQPDRPLNRAMFATILYRMAGQPAVNWSSVFSDVPAGQWYSNAILWASQQQIVQGYMDGRFGVEDDITREQIAKMMCLYGAYRRHDVSGRSALTGFLDHTDVSEWAIGYMQWAANAGMITGKHSPEGYRLDPKGPATRAECAKMIKTFCEKYGE